MAGIFPAIYLSSAPRRDGIRDRHRALRHLRMQPLDHLAIELDRALAGILRKSNAAI